MTIYVTRHGQSLTNAKHHVGSKYPLNSDNNILTIQGVHEALAYGHMAASDGRVIDRIIASPYSRTKQTAFLIASALSTCVPIQFDHRFEEIKWSHQGSFLHIADEHDYQKLHSDPDLRPTSDTENQQDVYNRVIPAFEEVCHTYKDENVLIVAHYFVVRAIQAFKAGLTYKNMPDFDPKNLEDIKFENG